jgi:hypothetical protein
LPHMFIMVLFVQFVGLVACLTGISD